MKPERILLVRHGQSEGNIDVNIYRNKPDYAMNLTSSGLAQSEQVGKHLAEITGGDAYFYVSPFYRTTQTLEEIIKSFPKVKEHHIREEVRLREQEWVNADGMSYKKGVREERDNYGSYFYRFAGGESAADVEDRISSLLNTMHRDFEKPHFPRNCILISHGMSIRVFLKRWFHMKIDDFEKLRNPKNCQVISLTLGEDGKYALAEPLAQHAALMRKF